VVVMIILSNRLTGSSVLPKCVLFSMSSDLYLSLVEKSNGPSGESSTAARRPASLRLGDHGLTVNPKNTPSVSGLETESTDRSERRFFACEEPYMVPNRSPRIEVYLHPGQLFASGRPCTITTILGSWCPCACGIRWH
jgi:hypothetical protein